jgi:hypothetical protein
MYCVAGQGITHGANHDQPEARTQQTEQLMGFMHHSVSELTDIPCARLPVGSCLGAV